MFKRLLRAPLTWAIVVVLAAGAGVGLYWFQPWKLVTDQLVDEALPAVPAPSAASTTPSGSASPSSTVAEQPGIVRRGAFVSHEHKTSGSAELVHLPDGRRQLVLRDLRTSNGPDLRVWLTDRPVVAGEAGWHVFDDGRWVELARLKGNHGNQVYDIPGSVDVADLTSVSIWCKRFAVSFGAAELAPA
ncbi:DM13 domain-containing protein [Micromonospora sp. NPDC049679]|uniref:DM13 domain-containing protein n=1 Tax=Micromonospora sp. NPDC049679 TaxID=3155920 RepID=UPI00340AF352